MKSPANSASELPKSSSSAALANAESVLSQTALSDKTLSSSQLSSKKMHKTKTPQANKLGFSMSKFTHHIHIASKSGKDSQMTYVYAAILPSFFFILGMLFIISFIH